MVEHDDNLPIPEYPMIDEDKPPPPFLKALLVFLALALLGGGLYLQSRFYRDHWGQPEKPGKDDPDHSLNADLRPPPADAYPWLNGSYDAASSIAARIPTPAGFFRTGAEAVPLDSFAHWLRYLPLKPGEQPVLLYNGQPKKNQKAHYAVIDIDTGQRDLQQCADAVMRLRAEYLYATNRWPAIHFNFTSGDQADWIRWAAGERPIIQGNKVTWTQQAAKDTSHANFRKYLDIVFAYAGTISLTKELTPVEFKDLQIGDVFIHPGSPGHAVIVVDMAVHPPTGRRVYLLAQSYMPAQDMHVLVNPNQADISPWYPMDTAPAVRTPEWTFPMNELRRFK